MTKTDKQHTHTGGSPRETVRLMVTIKRPAARKLAALDRQEKYRLLNAHNSQARLRLSDWLKAHDLADEVVSLSRGTAFNLLFMEATPDVAEKIRHAPGVLSVSQVGDVPVDLLG